MKNILELSIFLEPIFYKLVYMSIVATIIGIVILLVRKILKNIISPKWISRIWLIFIFSLIIPVHLRSSISIYKLIPDKIEIIQEISYAQEDNIISIFETSENTNDFSSEKSIESNFDENKESFDIRKLLPIIWLGISITTILIYLLTYIVLEIKIRKEPKNKNEILKEKNILPILDKVKENLKIKKSINIIFQDYIKMPSLFGIFNVRILLSNEINKLSEKEIEYILRHELCHYKRKDNILNIVFMILKSVYIFNPIIWILINQVKADMEIATDELVLSFENKESQKEYCRTLLNVSNIETDKFMVRAVCLSDNKKGLERRIDMVKIFEKFKNKKIISIISIVVILLIIAVFWATDTNYLSREDAISLLEKANEIENVYYEKIESNNSDWITKYYKKGDTLLQYDEKLGNVNSFSWLDSNSDKSYDIYYESKQFYINNFGEKVEFNSLYIDNLNNKEKFDYKYVGLEEIYDKKAYKIEIIQNLMKDNYINKEYLWIDIETGLILQKIRYSTLYGELKESNYTIYNYNFNEDMLEDMDFSEPKVEDYKDYEITNYFDFKERFENGKNRN